MLLLLPQVFLLLGPLEIKGVPFHVPHVPGPAPFDKVKLPSGIGVPLLLLVDAGGAYNVEEGLLVSVQPFPLVILRGGLHPLRGVLAITPGSTIQLRRVYVE